VVIPQTPPIECEGKNSKVLTAAAWSAFNARNYNLALECSAKVINRWPVQASEQQQAAVTSPNDCAAPKGKPTEQQVSSYFAANWALSDVATCLFIQGQTLEKVRRTPDACRAYRWVFEQYSCAHTWDPEGFFWRTADGARERYRDLHCADR